MPRLTDALISALSAAKTPLSLHIFPHISADSDAIGSGLALLRAFRKMGFSVRLFLEEERPGNLDFLDSEAEAELWPADEQLLGAPDIAMAIDCHELSRLGRRAAKFSAAPLRLILDHHLPLVEPEALSWIEPWRSSCGEMVCLFLRDLSARIGRDLMDRETASFLSAAIYMDSGSLSFSNVSADTFACMKELMRYEPPLSDICQRLFREVPLGKRRVEGLVFSRAAWYEEGRLAISYLDDDERKSLGAAESDLSGLSASLRDVRGTDLAIFVQFSPLDEQRQAWEAKISFRSSAAVDAAELARSYEGGGHARAAGGREGPLRRQDWQAFLKKLKQRAVASLHKREG